MISADNNDSTDNEPFALTAVLVKNPENEDKVPKTQHYCDVVVESQEDYVIYLDSEPFEVELPEGLPVHTQLHHYKARDEMQCLIQELKSQQARFINDMCNKLQAVCDTQSTFVDLEIRHGKDRTTTSIKRSRAALNKKIDNFTSLESCLRRHEMQQLQTLYNERMALAQAEWNEKEKRHRDAMIEQKCSIAGIEQTNRRLQSTVDEAHAEIERLKCLLHRMDTEKSSSQVISQVYVDALRESSRKANEAADGLRLDMNKLRKELEALNATKMYLDQTLLERDNELAKVRELLAESSSELIALQNINDITVEDLEEAKVKIQDLSIELDAIKTDLSAQKEFLASGETYIEQLTKRLAQATSQIHELIAEHDLAKSSWMTEKSDLEQLLFTLKQQLQAKSVDIHVEMYKLPTESSLSTIHHLTSLAQISQGIQKLKSPLKKKQSKQKPRYESLVDVLQREKVALPTEKVERAIALENSLREAIAIQLTYEFKRDFSIQLQKRLEHERYILEQKLDIVISRYLAEEHAAKRLMAKKVGTILRRRSEKPLLEASMPVRKLKDFLAESYAEMSIVQWNGEDVKQLKENILELEAEIQNLHDNCSATQEELNLQQLQLAQAELMQKERDLLIVSLTEKLKVQTCEFDAQIAKWKQENGINDEQNNQITFQSRQGSRATLNIRGQLPVVELKQSRPMSAMPTPTKTNSEAKKRPMTSRKQTPKPPLIPEHSRSVLHRELMAPAKVVTQFAPKLPPPNNNFVASLWVGEAGVCVLKLDYILDATNTRSTTKYILPCKNMRNDAFLTTCNGVFPL
ncbi:hypothetical protein THRCLA_09862 [Thraustotheca clavata]|uniref:Uncharacterized protein n=1 Tax=Thraustotheca clavata TaxID=74557 RepID=A0A1V9YUB5_9STRA|nr:hypothetical protein THRCLA_09862 [Thraustotheca clavata]